MNNFNVNNYGNNYNSYYNDASEMESTFQLMLVGSAETLDRWENLLQRNALHHRIDLKTFKELHAFVNDNYLDRQYHAQIDEVKSRFLNLLTGSMQSLTKEASPDKAKAEHLMAVANDCLQQETVSNESLKKAVEQLKAKFENKSSVISSVASMAIVPNGPCLIQSIPNELNNLLMSYLNVKELGRMAQVSKAYNVFANAPAIWQAFCQKDGDIDLKDVSKYSNSFKLLYKEEADLGKFTKEGMVFFKLKGGTISITLKAWDPALKGKHVYRIVKKEFEKKPELCGGENLKNLTIIPAGRVLQPEDNVCDQKWNQMACVFIVFKKSS